MLFLLTEYQIVAADASVAASWPAEVLQSFAQVGHVGNIIGFQVLGKFLLNGSDGPEVLTLVVLSRHENAGQHRLHR